MRFKIGKLEIVSSPLNPICIYARLTGLAVSIPPLGRVYVSSKVYEWLAQPSTRSRALLVHETTHVLQYEDSDRSGLGWLFKYFFSRDFRAAAESEAYLASSMVYRMNGECFAEIIKHAEDVLDSWRYFWSGVCPVLYAKAPTPRIMRAIGTLKGTVYEVKNVTEKAT